MSIALRLGTNIAAARRRQGMSQETLALRASLHRTEVGLLERGERMPRVDTLIRIAAGLEVSVGELIDGIAWEPGEIAAGRFSVEDGSR